MVEVSAKLVGELRNSTGAGFADCKNALVEANGDFEKAVTILKKKGVATAAKKLGRAANEGVVESYIHGDGRIGVLLELNCETDFVAKNSEFRKLARDICMHIAAASPLYISRSEVSADLVEKEKEIATAQAAGKPQHAIDKIVEGKLDKWYQQICLLDQSFVKDQDKTVNDLIGAMIAIIGENIRIGRFSRFKIGEQ
ncbi:MAG: translation elongation factor Ts [Puniceicoccales bacterium]|jgi:elongation factor Ts|nr:translation elongation factor Ts [Puniceicoccales bacterium]